MEIVTNPNITDIAKWFLHKEAMTQKKLQKLCYYAVAWGWALMDREIATDAEFQAWIHGPVSPTLYANYKSHGWNLIPKIEEPIDFENDIDELLSSVWYTYGDKHGNELEALTHNELPWKKARGHIGDDTICKTPIDAKDMKEYYWSIYRGKDEEI